MCKMLLLSLLGVQSANAYPKLGDYMPVSNVLEHAQISLDIEKFNDALVGEEPDYDLAMKIYTQGGGGSCKSPSKTRKFVDFATKDLSGESFADFFKLAGNPVGFWDTFMTDGLKGEGTFKDLSRVKRVTSLKKGLLGLVTYYASHELEAAIVKAEENDTRSDSSSGHAWDEGWAFYYGIDAEGKHSPWEVAMKRDGDFPDGLQVRTEIVPQFNKGLISVRSDTYSQSDAILARDTIYQMWAITYLRAALKYLQLAEHNYDDKAHAEGFAYYKAIDGWVHAKGAAAANKMREALDISKTSIEAGTYCAAKKELESAYSQMGLSCEKMGSFKDEKIDCGECEDAQQDSSWPEGSPSVAAVEGTWSNMDCDVMEDTTEADDVTSMAHGLKSGSLALLCAAILAGVGWLR